MKRVLAIATIVLGVAWVVSCSGDSPESPTADSDLEVLVHWDDAGIAGKRVEVLELGVEKLTDADGLARFALPAGDYTLRAYEINAGGPALLHVDRPFTARSGETTHVEVVDCLPCV
jgi:hypothetical protein